MDKNNFQTQRESIQDNPFPPLTHEEIRTLRQCNREAFFQRSLPLSAGAMLGMAYCMRKGYVNKKFSWAKILFPGMAGFIIGKLSYMNICKNRLLNLPDSPLAERLKKADSPIGYQEMMKEFAAFPSIPPSEPTRYPKLGPITTPYDASRSPDFGGTFGSAPDISSMPRYDLDSSRYANFNEPKPNDQSYDATNARSIRQNKGFSDPGSSSRYSNLPTINDHQSQQPPLVTYEELRQRNRNATPSSRSPANESGSF